ncbi:MAG: phage portal protein, partial [Pseudomonadota bacterium]
TFFGIPPFMLGDTEKSTSWGAEIEQQSLGFIRYTLQPHLVNWEQAFNRALLSGSTSLDRGVGARFDVSELARGDDNGRATYNAQALQWGWMSPNEVRRREGLKPRPDGEEFYPPPNMTADSGDGQAEESDA